MREITASGQTVDEAVQTALEQLNVEKDQTEINVIDEGKKGVLGLFGTKRAIVHVSVKENQVDAAEKYLKSIIEDMGLDIQIQKTSDDKIVTFEFIGEKIALLIGKRGQTLNALQYLTHLVINNAGEDFYKVVLDAEGYRARREETLEQLAFKMASKAKRLRKKVVLEAMPSFERKIIHKQLQDDSDIETFSNGRDPHRHIVIKPKLK